MSQQPQQQPEIIIEPDKMAGVWANYARVSHSPYEFTLDFARLDFSAQPQTGIVVARVSVSPLLITQFVDALNNNWQSYAEKALPKEVTNGGDKGGEDEAQEGGG